VEQDGGNHCRDSSNDAGELMKLLKNARRWHSEFHSWMRAMLHRRRLESEMHAELENHFQALTEDLVRAGHSP
jgi:hypothetical protein